MLILAADTSTRSASIALVRDGTVLGETTLSLGRKHSTTFMPALEELMHRCGLAHADLSAYACTVGPGSYTGIRIGLATLQMMAFAARKPVYGVSTLDALALPLLVSRHLLVCPMLDARSGRIFGSALDGDGTHHWVAEANLPIESFAAALYTALEAKPDATVVLCGDAAALQASRLRDLLPRADIHVAVGALQSPLASSVAELAERQAAAGDPGDPARMSASYLSPSQAEREAAIRERKP
jgi:tRNA threonylcarbamoyladenosine biosynthesis protein TsaB